MNEAIQQLEQSVIGAVLLKPETLALLPTLESVDFQTVYARACWDAVRNLEAANAPIDLTTIVDDLARRGCQGPEWDAYLGECALRVPVVTNAIEYAKRLKDVSLRKRVLEGMASLIADAQRDPDMRGAEVLTACLRLASSFDAEQPGEASTIGQVVQRRVKELERLDEERKNGGRALTGFPTGVVLLDEKIGGWQPRIASIVAARPAMGKSSLGLATADACSKSGIGVHVFSLEDGEAAYADRSISRESKVDAEKLRSFSVNRGEMQDIGDAMRRLARRQGWLFDDRSGITAEEIVRSVRRKKKENRTRLVIVDYIQLIRKPHPRMSTHEALSENITTLADAAKHDDMAYVVMSQLNRELEKREDKRPQLSDLRESGSLEERSKCVVGVYRGSVYGDPKDGIDYDSEAGESAPTKDEFAKRVQLIVLKNSNGRTGVVDAAWHGPTTRME